MKTSLRIYLGLLLVLIIAGCSSNGAVIVDINSFLLDEKNDLQKESFQSLDISSTNEIISWEQAIVRPLRLIMRLCHGVTSAWNNMHLIMLTIPN